MEFSLISLPSRFCLSGSFHMVSERNLCEGLCILMLHHFYKQGLQFYVVSAMAETVATTTATWRSAEDQNQYEKDVLFIHPSEHSSLSLTCSPLDEDDPKTFTEAMTSRDVAFWKETVNDEMDPLLANNTWVLTNFPLGSKAIGCKWVFRRKYNADGSIQTFKARIVAKGFKKKEGGDYFDTYAPVARIASIRVLLALASIYNLNYLGRQIILVLNIGKALEESFDISKELRI
ncbi:UNVERIFIED_CONTAM: putative mitochondrial protein [Sesamum calycinum]|uniref:Mitochondrial protein n=1 Tax=Sesamum calycinum TaxID=2727403 RepID=A0AAW2KE39_9LAMI